MKREKVNKNTRSGKNGKCLECPICGHKIIVYHFAWGACRCGCRNGGCYSMVEKLDWLVIE